jgi:hypothetical protein
MAKGIIIESVKDALAAGSNIIQSAEKEVMWLLEPAILALSFQFGIPNKTKMLIENGGRVREITRISGSSLDVARKLFDNGEEVPYRSVRRSVHACRRQEREHQFDQRE